MSAKRRHSEEAAEAEDEEEEEEEEDGESSSLMWTVQDGKVVLRDEEEHANAAMCTQMHARQRIFQPENKSSPGCHSS